MNHRYKTIVVENDPRQLDILCSLLESDDYKSMFHVAKRTPFFNDAVTALLKEKYDLAIFDVYLDQSDTCYGLIEKVGRDRFTILAVATDQDSVDPRKSHTLGDPIIFFDKPYRDHFQQFLKDLNEKAARLEKAEKDNIIYRYPVKRKVQEQVETTYLLDENIVYIKSYGNYVHYHLCGGVPQYVETDKIPKVLLRMNPKFFIRVNERVIINIMYLQKRIREGKDGGGVLILSEPGYKEIEVRYQTEYRHGLDKMGFV